jgi:stigma-specific protein Stig1
MISEKRDVLRAGLARPERAGRKLASALEIIVRTLFLVVLLLCLSPPSSAQNSPNSSGICPGCQINCGTYCADFANDRNHCGSCNNSCGPRETCVSGACRVGNQGGAGCRTGQASCGASGCADLLNDPNHCGSCNNSCGPRESCVSGACRVGGNQGGAGCRTGQASCGASGCADLLNDPNHCGSCNNRCGPRESCVSGACRVGGNQGGAGCRTGQVSCGASGCADLLNDPNHCGSCNNRCGPRESCVSGACRVGGNQGGAGCRTGQVSCGASGCADLLNDPNHCGSCNNSCGPRETCARGVCTRTKSQLLDDWIIHSSTLLQLGALSSSACLSAGAPPSRDTSPSHSP